MERSQRYQVNFKMPRYLAWDFANRLDTNPFPHLKFYGFGNLDNHSEFPFSYLKNEDNKCLSHRMIPSDLGTSRNMINYPNIDGFPIPPPATDT